MRKGPIQRLSVLRPFMGLEDELHRFTIHTVKVLFVNSTLITRVYS